MCDQKESIVLHRREKKLVGMLAADGKYGSRCVCVCVCGGGWVWVHVLFHVHVHLPP